MMLRRSSGSVLLTHCYQTKVSYTRKLSTEISRPTLPTSQRSLRTLSGKFKLPVNKSIQPKDLDLKYNDACFNFTRGRFVVDEAFEMSQRHVRFDVNELARIAAEAVGANVCVRIEKYPDGMYNKAMLLTMDDGTQAVAKVPNPNSGMPHFTTASEVATMDFVRPKSPSTGILFRISTDSLPVTEYYQHSSSEGFRLELEGSGESCRCGVYHHGETSRD